MTDLDERLREAVNRRLELARAATPGPWLHVDFADPSGQPMTTDGGESSYMGCGSVISMDEHVAGCDVAAPNGDLYPRSGYSPKEDMAHIATNDPATEIRRCERDLRVLDRHRRVTFGDSYLPEVLEIDRDQPWCHTCRGNLWPCADLLDLAYALEVSTDD